MRLFTIFFFLVTIFTYNTFKFSKSSKNGDRFIYDIKKKSFQKLNKSPSATSEGFDTTLAKDLVFYQSYLFKISISASISVPTKKSLFSKIVTFEKQGEV